MVGRIWRYLLIKTLNFLFQVAFAAMDCTVHVSSCTAHDVTGYPTILYFNYGKNSQKYMGGREVCIQYTFTKTFYKSIGNQ